LFFLIEINIILTFMHNKIERINRVISILWERNGASIKELARELEVSEMTIRRDLEQLRLDNIVSLVHGAAIYKAGQILNSRNRGYHLALEKGVNNPEKEKIGKAAARRVLPGDTIIIDIGTTTEQLVRHLPQDMAITALCVTMNSLMEIYKKNVENLIFGGGFFHTNTQLFESVETIDLIRRTRANKLFLSAAGISRELGLTTVNPYEVNVKHACIASSQLKILLANSKKFDQVRPAFFAPLDIVDIIITDDGISTDWVKVFSDMGIEVEIV
jgi:DeoR family deoxyribose operon repressor